MDRTSIAYYRRDNRNLKFIEIIVTSKKFLFICVLGRSFGKSFFFSFLFGFLDKNINRSFFIAIVLVIPSRFGLLNNNKLIIYRWLSDQIMIMVEHDWPINLVFFPFIFFKSRRFEERPLTSIYIATSRIFTSFFHNLLLIDRLTL